MMRRRGFLKVFGLLAAAWSARPHAALAAAPFDAASVRAMARMLADRPYAPPPTFSIGQLPEMDYATYGGIRFRPEAALWADAELPFRVRFFHPGLFFREPVAIHVVEAGEARRIAFDPDRFAFDDPALAAAMGDGLDHVGFNLLYEANWQRDIASFLGASYFRAVGASMQFGKSARGIAVDTTHFGHEEFPAFRAFWLERPAPDRAELVVHALMDGPSVTGAYRIAIRPGATTEMDIDATVFPRRDIADVGIAPITSMYMMGENDPVPPRVIARPEAHDSDGLAIWRGVGEWAWRPLENPETPRVSVFVDTDPRGFGLLQRDRVYDHYRDIGAAYEARPHLWVEPLDPWGQGGVVLVELPTDDEVFDNIVAYWRPATPLAAGSEHTLRYRLYWGDGMPNRLDRPAEVVATFTGAGGRPGARNHTRKFIIEFAGGALDMLERDGPPPEAVVTASAGTIDVYEVIAVPNTRRWRLEFDVDPLASGTEAQATADGPASAPTAAIELRCFLRVGASALTETWLYRLDADVA